MTTLPIPNTFAGLATLVRLTHDASEPLLRHSLWFESATEKRNTQQAFAMILHKGGYLASGIGIPDVGHHLQKEGHDLLLNAWLCVCETPIDHPPDK